MIKIDYNSLHARLYRWFYSVDKMPVSLCPYFWKLVIAILIAPGMALMQLPYYVLQGFKKTDLDGNGERIIVGLVMYLGLWALGCIGIAITSLFIPVNFSEDVIAIGWVSMGIITLGVGTFLTVTRQEKRRNLLRNRLYNGEITIEQYTQSIQKDFARYSPANWLLIKAIKAWYQRSCPRVDWKH
jgi:hypothetical protein